MTQFESLWICRSSTDELLESVVKKKKGQGRGSGVLYAHRKFPTAIKPTIELQLVHQKKSLASCQ